MAEALAALPGPRRTVRDHRRRRRQPRRHRRAGRRPGGASTRTSSASCTTSRTRATARRCGSGFRAARYDARRLHRRRPPVPGGGPGPADRAPRRARTPRTWSSATGSSGPTRRAARLCPRLSLVACASSSASESATSTAPASCSGARPSTGVRLIRRGVLLGRAADQAARPRARASPRSACRTTRAWPARPSGANPRVVLRAVRDFWRLRIRLWLGPRPRPAARASSPRASGWSRPSSSGPSRWLLGPCRAS